MPSLPDCAIGKTSLRVTRLGLGTAAIGYLYSPVSAAEARATIECARDLGTSLFDTAPLYGDGTAEIRLGEAIRDWPRDSYVLSTKVGYDIGEGARAMDRLDFYWHAPHDFSYDGVMRSFERSLRRLGLERIDIAHIHDPDDSFSQAMNGAYKALHRLRAAGTIRALSAGMNQAEMLARFAAEGDFDCFLLAGRYTLLEQGALESLFPICLRKGISVLIGGVFNSGILADPYALAPQYNYHPAPDAQVGRARRIQAVCRRHAVPIKAAAIQFAMAHPVVASVLCGARSALEFAENVAMSRVFIPPDFWAELKRERLLQEDAPVERPEER